MLACQRQIPEAVRNNQLASSPLLGTNGRLARWGNSRPPISPPRARPVIQGAVENGCALAFSAGALVNFRAPVGTITLCSQLSGHSSRLQHGEWRRRAPDTGLFRLSASAALRCGRHLISGGHQIDRFRYFLRQTVQQAPPQLGNGIGFLKCLESYLVTVIPQRFARGRPNISVALQATGISPVAISITAHHSTAPCLCCQELVDAKLRGCEPDSAPLQCDRDKTLPPKGCSPADCLLCRAG